MVLMALDVGSKRIGVAVADPSGSFALPVGTIERTNRRDDLAIARKLSRVVRRRRARRRRSDHAAGRARHRRALAIDEFVERLREIFGGPIHRVDERMTTAQATKTLDRGRRLAAKRRKSSTRWRRH